jgi:hypothetical protein
MTKIPTGKIAQVVKEKRSTQIARGLKQGVIKGAVDKVLDQVAGPISDKLTPMLHNLHPNLQIADPAVKALIEFAVLNALAEVLEFSGPALAKAPGVKMSPEDAKEKTQALAQWMRNYSGEKFGEQIAETAAALIPVFANMIQTTDLSSLLEAVESEKEEEVESEATAL